MGQVACVSPCEIKTVSLWNDTLQAVTMMMVNLGMTMSHNGLYVPLCSKVACPFNAISWHSIVEENSCKTHLQAAGIDGALV